MSGSNNVVSLNKEKAVARAKLARMSAPVHMLQEKSRLMLQRLLQTLFDNTDDALFELADKAGSNMDQNIYFESMREVRVCRRDIESQFIESLTDAFAAVAMQQGDVSPASDNDLSQYNINDLALVQNDELEEVVAVDSMVNRANNLYGEKVQHLGMRIDSLVPQKIYQKNNPLGPDVICRAFACAIKPLEIDIKAKLVLLKLFDKHLLTQLNKFYQVCNQLLIEHNILPSMRSGKSAGNQRRAAPAPGSTVGRAAAAAGQTRADDSDMGLQGAPFSGGDAAVHNAQDGSVLQVLRGLMPEHESNDKLVLRSGGGRGSGAALPATELVSALSQMQHQYTAAASEMVAGKQLKAAIENYIAAQKPSARINELDDDVINLVNMLFEFILDDHTLAAPMKALLGRLQIPILKVAIADKSFFSKGGHPARRLLNEMSAAAVGWLDEGKERDPLYEKINTIVQTLLTEFEDDVSIFGTLLTDFVSFIEKERRRASILEQRTLDAEDGKAKAEYARHIVAAHIEELLGGQVLPAAADKLLRDAWGNVMFLIALKEGTESHAWKNATVTARDLIWSLAAPLAPGERTQLLKLVPDLLKRLRAGLDSISYNPFEMTELFKALEKLHLERIRGKSVVPDTAEPAAAAPVAPEPPTLSVAVEVPEPESVAETPAAQSAAPVQNETKSAAADEASEVDKVYLQQVDNLAQGAWFEMTDTGGGVYRCRLAAVLKQVGKYIFVNRSGVKVAEETRESLALLLKSGRLNTLNDGVLFDRALESVISSLRQTRSGSRTS